MTQQINLLEPSLLPSREWVTGRRVLAVSAVFAVLMLGQYVYERAAMARLLQATASAAVADAEPLPASELEPQIAAAEARVRQNEALIDAAVALAELPENNGPRLQRLFAALPESVWLQQLRFAGGGHVHLVGGAQKPADLVSLSEALGRTPGFERMPVRVFSLDQARADEEDADGAASRTPVAARPRWFGFEMSSQLGQGGGAAEGVR
jgi:Tfp pilus assembly protein PilN